MSHSVLTNDERTVSLGSSHTQRHAHTDSHTERKHNGRTFV